MSGDIVTVQILVNRIPQFKSFLTGFGCSGIHTKKTSMTQQQANVCQTVTTQIHVYKAVYSSHSISIFVLRF